MGAVRCGRAFMGGQICSRGQTWPRLPPASLPLLAWVALPTKPPHPPFWALLYLPFSRLEEDQHSSAYL